MLREMDSAGQLESHRWNDVIRDTTLRTGTGDQSYYSLLLTTHYLLLTTYYLLPGTYFLPHITYYLLPTSYFLLPTTYYLPTTTYHLLKVRTSCS